jgi:hypothetical protein
VTKDLSLMTFVTTALTALFLLFRTNQRIGVTMVMNAMKAKNDDRPTNLRHIGANKNSRRFENLENKEKKD